MTTSGTYAYNPATAEIGLYAFQLIGVRPTALLQEHMMSLRNAANMLQSRWANQGVNLWKVDLVTTTIVQDQSTYPVDANTVVILDAYITSDQGGGVVTDRIITPVSRSEYASYPNKQMNGFPTVFWFDRLLSPTVTIWPVPGNGVEATYLKYYRVTQIQDANLVGGLTLDIPYLWLEAFAYGLAHRLALVWAPQRAQEMKMLADEAYDIAARQNEETANFYMTPQLSSYFR